MGKLNRLSSDSVLNDLKPLHVYGGSDSEIDVKPVEARFLKIPLKVH
jgi:hypothetical protein